MTVDPDEDRATEPAGDAVRVLSRRTRVTSGWQAPDTSPLGRAPAAGDVEHRRSRRRGRGPRRGVDARRRHGPPDRRAAGRLGPHRRRAERIDTARCRCAAGHRGRPGGGRCGGGRRATAQPGAAGSGGRRVQRDRLAGQPVPRARHAAERAREARPRTRSRKRCRQPACRPRTRTQGWPH